MARWWRTNPCERTTQWISLDLDGELSQLERVALARHLSGCARCRAVSNEVGAFTRMLREAPLLELEREIAYAAPRRAKVRVARRAAASLAFASVVGAAVIGGFVLPNSGTVVTGAITFSSVQEQKQFAHIEVQRLEPAGFVVSPQERCLGSCAL